RHLLPLLVVLSAFLLPSPAHACNIPVFRYALERWKPDAYDAVVFHKGPLDPDLAKLVAEIRKAADDPKTPANVNVVTVDLSGDVEEGMLKLWQLQTNTTLPWMVLRYPHSTLREPSAWSGPFDAQLARSLVQSPVRRELARRLMKGDSVVWVLVE